MHALVHGRKPCLDYGTLISPAISIMYYYTITIIMMTKGNQLRGVYLPKKCKG